jgi:dTMP kinase
VVLDVDAGTGRSRRGGVHDRLEREDDAFHEAARRHFLALAAAHPDRYLVVDATLPPEQIHALVVARLQAKGIAVGEAS